ncbi:hypothetical protein CRE_17596 [Caenorhabditis remanei]|uniref:F-box domain-containing protein n=1 Tax=Caenorhabditis remanei TaxID=31234 RepID=E3NF52_CAERE|nr:hypothetical protein CRE_17596 [Caenorhabditis remanei]
MTSPFPLFHVPILPLRIIIDFMEPNELVPLSFCSQKSHSVIKSQRKVSCDERLQVWGSNMNASFSPFTDFDCVLSTSNSVHTSSAEKEEYVKLGGQQIRVKYHRLRKYLITYWEDILTGLEAITDYVTDLFNIDVSEVYISKDSFKMIEWVNRRQKTPLKKVVLDWRLNPSEDEINYILRDCQCSSEILIYSKAPPNYRFSNNFRRIDFLDISNSNWVTIDNLLSMDGIDIVLEASSLSNSDLNVFLRHWLSGGCPRLKLFSAETGSLRTTHLDTGELCHMESIYDVRMASVLQCADRRTELCPFGSEQYLINGFDLQREDGATATVCYDGYLRIVVWPEITCRYN